MECHLETSSAKNQSTGPGFFFMLMKFGIKLGPKFATFAVKLAKTAKLGKAGLFAASLGSYAYLLTWQFAVIIMAQLFIHESGHVWAMRRCGIPVKGMYFLPFVGGVAVANGSWKSPREEAFIALAGPVWGLACALVCAALYPITGNPLFAAGASWMCFVNIFNLLPVHPLDGGRVFKTLVFSIGKTFGMISVITLCALGIGFSLYSRSFFISFIIFIGLAELMGSRPTNRLSKMEMLITAASYAFLFAILIGIMNALDSIPGSDLAMESLRGLE
ncbi:MAG: site-2 protease family protein [Candidatus Uhrbacteria bacterium]|nr:site-2 protease family protein [Candidatus Uhrbacteria bacterium]